MRSLFGLTLGCMIALASSGVSAQSGAAPAIAGFEHGRSIEQPRLHYVHRRPYHHCHRRRGYRRYCHQGAWDWRDETRDYGRPYYPRETWRRRQWNRNEYRRRSDRDRPYWRRHPNQQGPSVYRAL